MVSWRGWKTSGARVVSWRERGEGRKAGGERVVSWRERGGQRRWSGGAGGQAERKAGGGRRRAGDCDDADPRSREIHAFPERIDDENGRNIRYTW